MYKLYYLFAICLFATSGIYSFHIISIEGNDVALSSFQGKKILIVNIATGSSRTSQLTQLETLQQRYGDSLVIIAFPSNSFGHEPRSNSEIKTFCTGTYHTSFLIAQKGEVTGSTKQGLYTWLSNTGDNGAVHSEIKNDFQKFLISTDGRVIGMFAANIAPLDPIVTKAIEGIE